MSEHAIRAVAHAHQRDLLERMPVRRLISESPPEVAAMLRDILIWLAEHRLSHTQEAA